MNEAIQIFGVILWIMLAVAATIGKSQPKPITPVEKEKLKGLPQQVIDAGLITVKPLFTEVPSVSIQEYDDPDPKNLANVQNVLDELQKINLSELWSTNLSAKERASILKIAKQRLKQAKQTLRAEQDSIKRRWDGRKSHEAKREKEDLAPFMLIDQLIGRLEISFAELENAIKFDRPLPDLPLMGDTIGGGGIARDYIISSKNGVELFKWRRMLEYQQTIRSSAQNTYQATLQVGKNTKAEIEMVEEAIRLLEPKATETMTHKIFRAILILAILYMLVATIGLFGMVLASSVTVDLNGLVPFLFSLVAAVLIFFIVPQMGFKELEQAKKQLTSLRQTHTKLKAKYEETRDFYKKAADLINKMNGLIKESQNAIKLLDTEAKS